MFNNLKPQALLCQTLAVLLIALPIAGGRAVSPAAPPPPQFVPIDMGVHVVATWPGPDHYASPSDSAPAADTTLLSKTASAASVAADGRLHYSIGVTNATNITDSFRITDTLPAGPSYITGTASGGLVYDALSTSLTATTTLNAFHGDVITTTGAPPYTEIVSNTLAANICQTYFTECDDSAITLAGVPFRYLGIDYTTVTLDSNGFVMPGSGDLGVDSQNQQLPDSPAPNNVIAPFWDDLDLNGQSSSDTGGGDWLYAVLHDAGSNADYLVVEWHNAQKKGDSSTAYSFQVWIQLHTEHITFAYANPAFTGTTSSASIGFENSNGTLGHSYLYHGAGQVPAPGAELQLIAVFDAAQFGFEVQAAHYQRGCSSITNTVNLANGSGTLNATASATTNLFGPCQFLSLINR